MSFAMSPMGAESVTAAPPATEATPIAPIASVLAPLGPVLDLFSVEVLATNSELEAFCPLAPVSTALPGSCCGEGGGGGSQTPWTQNIDASYFDLTHLECLQIQDKPGDPSIWICTNSIGELVISNDARIGRVWITQQGQVGIRTMSPSVLDPTILLNVWGSANFADPGQIILGSTDGVVSIWAGKDGFGLGSQGGIGTFNNSDLLFWTNNGPATGVGMVLTATGTTNVGKVGIGVQYHPAYMLDVQDDIRAGGKVLIGAGFPPNVAWQPWTKLIITSPVQSAMSFTSANGGPGWIIGRSNLFSNDQDFFIYDGTSDATPVSIVPDGSGRNYIGINSKTDPLHALDVIGNVNITGNYLSGEVQFAGFDGVGVALTNITSINGGPAVLALPANGQYIGIGHVDPAYQLDVAGDVNITDPGGANGYAFRINGVPIATGGGQVQSPWLSDINGGNFRLGNVSGIGIGMANPAAYTALDTVGDIHMAWNAPLVRGPRITLDGVSYTVTFGMNSPGNAYQISAGGGFGGVFFFGDLVTGNVGIRKSSAAYALDVTGDINTTGVFRVNGTPLATGSQTPWTSNIAAANFNLNNVGAIGIGTSATSSAALLNIVDARFVDATVAIQNNNSGGSAGVNLNAGGVSAGGIVAGGVSTDSTWWQNKVVLYAMGTTPLAFYVNQTAEAMRITSTGLVGIGTSAPQSSLEVNGLIRATTNIPVPTSGKCTEMYFDPTNNTGGIDAYDYTVGAFLPVSIQAGGLTLVGGTGINYEATNHRFLSGNVAIGSTALPRILLEVGSGVHSAVTGAPGFTLAAIGVMGATSTNSDTLFLNMSNAPFAGEAEIGAYTYSTNNFIPLHINASRIVMGDPSRYPAFVGIGMVPGFQLQLSNDSAAKPATNTWTVPSDIRIERNVRRFEGDMEVIRRLDPIVAEYNGLAGTLEGDRVVGFIAQDLQKIVPQCVSSAKQKLNRNDAGLTDVLGVNTHEIFFHMLRAVQRLDERVTRMENAVW